MSRQYCAACGFPEKVCLCHSISKIYHCPKISILQHPKETGHSKNTAKLIGLVIPNATIYVGHLPADFDNAQKHTNALNTTLIYPSALSTPIESASTILKHVEGSEDKELKALTLAHEHLILLDGSWRQAYALWQSNPWLHGLQAHHFDTPPNRQYNIRRSKKNHQLSTLEALAYSLDVLYKIDPRPLQNALAGLKSHWLKYSKP